MINAQIDIVMDTLNRFITWLKGFPFAIRVLLMLAVATIVVLLSTSCGSTTRATIRNNADGTTTSVTITTNNPTQMEVNPSATLTPQK